MLYRLYICNFYINKDAKLKKAFHNCFRLPYQHFFELVEIVCKDELFVRWCG
jgi:hypothetical protein